MTDLVVIMIRKLPALLKLAGGQSARPGNLPAIKRTLEALKQDKDIRCLGKRRDATRERLALDVK